MSGLTRVDAAPWGGRTWCWHDRVMTTASTRSEPSSTSDVGTARSESEPAAPSDVEKAAARAAGQALAARLVRNAAARWLTGDEITRIGRQLAGSIDQYERLHRQPPTWADALAGVDPVLLAPLQAVPDGWPSRPAYWATGTAATPDDRTG